MIKRSTMSTQVYTVLKGYIIEGRYEASEKLTEQGVAKELSVSATPVREAFKKLETEGFIESIAFKGVRVKAYSKEDIKMAYHIRAKLQSLALKETMKNMDEKKILELEKILDEARSVNDLHIYKRYMDFHDWIIRNSNSDVILKTLISLNAVISIDRLMHNTEKSDLLDEVNTDENYAKLFNFIKNAEFENAQNLLEEMILSIMLINLV